ncbi:MAG: GAF domain-containing protein [Dehalococcoidia bacterium]|nr:GAF domain-containing protein [Dehalococcoidia bacterium]
MGRQPNDLLLAVHEAALAISDELRLDVILGKIIDKARALVSATYGALGVPDGSGGFSRFITSGMSDEQIEAIGPLPRQHGLLALMLEDPEPVRLPNIKRHSRFEWWPQAHPDMKSFLGVPIVYQNAIVGAFYLTDKVGAPEFTDSDQEAITMLAAHAGIAIENARLFERSRELTAIEERNRLARDLHDSVAQTLFNIVLEADVAIQLMESDSTRSRAHLENLAESARRAAGEIRSLIFELRPPDLEKEGLSETLRKHVEALSRAHRIEISFDSDGDCGVTAHDAYEIYRVTQEALHNALKHANPNRLGVVMTCKDGAILVRIDDDGRGFDTEDASVRAHSLGLTSMEERMKALGGRLEIISRPGSGTSVSVTAPLRPRQTGEVLA